MRILTITLKYTLHRYRYVANCIQYRVIVAVFNLKKSGNWLENLENKYSTKKQLLGWRQVLLKLWILVRWLIFKFIWRYCIVVKIHPSLLSRFWVHHVWTSLSYLDDRSTTFINTLHIKKPNTAIRYAAPHHRMERGVVTPFELTGPPFITPRRNKLLFLCQIWFLFWWKFRGISQTSSENDRIQSEFVDIFNTTRSKQW